MKKNLAILIVPLFITAFNACDQEQPGASEEFIITGIQNGNRWVAPANGGYHSDKDTVDISGLKTAENEVLGENIFFANIPAQIGKYPLNKRTTEGSKATSVFYSIIGLDALNCRFDLDETSESFIIVEIADLESKTISGTFQAVYIRDPNDDNYDPYLPDTLRFTDGFFRVKLKMPR